MGSFDMHMQQSVMVAAPKPRFDVLRWSRRVGAFVGLAAVSGLSFAAADVSAATDGLQSVITAVETVGPLMITAVAAGIVFKWVVAFLI